RSSGSPFFTNTPSSANFSSTLPPSTASKKMVFIGKTIPSIGINSSKLPSLTSYIVTLELSTFNFDFPEEKNANTNIIIKNSTDASAIFFFKDQTFFSIFLSTIIFQIDLIVQLLCQSLERLVNKGKCKSNTKTNRTR